MPNFLPKQALSDRQIKLPHSEEGLAISQGYLSRKSYRIKAFQAMATYIYRLKGITMRTKFGKLLDELSVGPSELGRKTGLSRQRISQLAINPSACVSLYESCLIAKALEVDLNYLGKALYGFSQDAPTIESQKEDNQAA